MKTQEITTTTENQLSVVDLSGKLPDLSSATEYPFDLMADYWTPELPMESKRVFFDKIATRPVQDQQTGDIIELECALFIEPSKDGFKTIANGSKRLVGALEAHSIQQGTPLLITFLGKKKNRTNQFQSDNWSIKPLRLNIA
ncbi:MAG: hypothetical protein J7577_01020 [Sphingobacteriaceae bacterium]|nr:hypothetical protein [Sphingobacteriaceae bacterium]